MNVEIVTVAEQLLFWENFFRIFGIVSLQCVVKADLNKLLDSYEALFQGIKGGGVEHLLLDLGRVRTPGHQEQLLLLAGL